MIDKIFVRIGFDENDQTFGKSFLPKIVDFIID